MNTRRVIFAFVLLAFVLAGCAAKPEKIKPAYVSVNAYRGWSCTELVLEQHRLAEALTDACRTQRKARDHDTAGLILLCLPVGSMCGDNRSQEIARLKGEWDALHAAAAETGCQLSNLDDPVAKK